MLTNDGRLGSSVANTNECLPGAQERARRSLTAGCYGRAFGFFDGQWHFNIGNMQAQQFIMSIAQPTTRLQHYDREAKIESQGLGDRRQVMRRERAKTPAQSPKPHAKCDEDADGSGLAGR